MVREHRRSRVVVRAFYATQKACTGRGNPTLDAKQVYAGSEDGIAIHQRLIDFRNKIAAHTDESDLVRLTLAGKEETDRIIITNLSTNAMSTNEIPNSLEAVAHAGHFATISINNYTDHLEKKVCKTISLD